MIKKIRYFAVCTTDIQATIKMYQDYFDLVPMTEVRETKWGFKNVMLGDGEHAFVEIMEPSDPNSALARFMRDRAGWGNPQGQGIYLVGLEVDDLKGTVERIRSLGGQVAEDPELEVVWVHPLSFRNAYASVRQAKE